MQYCRIPGILGIPENPSILGILGIPGLPGIPGILRIPAISSIPENQAFLVFLVTSACSLLYMSYIEAELECQECLKFW